MKVEGQIRSGPQSRHVLALLLRESRIVARIEEIAHHPWTEGRPFPYGIQPSQVFSDARGNPQFHPRRGILQRDATCADAGNSEARGRARRPSLLSRA